jgi:hypothetical protein
VGYPKRMRDYEQGRSPRRVELSDLPPWPGDDPGGDPDGPPPPPMPPGTSDAADPGHEPEDDRPED